MLFSVFVGLLLALGGALPALGLLDVLLIVFGVFGGAAVVRSCSSEGLESLSKHIDMTWLLDPLRVLWGEVKYRRTSRQLVRRHRFKSQSELPHRLQNASNEFIDLIIRDFVTSWYDEITGDEEMAHETQALLKHATNRAFNIMKRVDAPKLVRDVILKFSDHMKPMRKAWKQVESNRGNVQSEDDVLEDETCLSRSAIGNAYSQHCQIHPAMLNRESEMTYIRNVVDILLDVLLPPNALNCIPGVFALKEIISCNAVLSLIQHLSDPDWVNQTVIDVLEEMPLEVYRKLEECTDEDNWETWSDTEETERKESVDTVKAVTVVSVAGKDSKLKPPVREKHLPLRIGSEAGSAASNRLQRIEEDTSAMERKQPVAVLSSSCDTPLHTRTDQMMGMPSSDHPSVSSNQRQRSESLPAVFHVHVPKMRTGTFAQRVVQDAEPVDYASMLAVAGIESVKMGKEYKVFVLKVGGGESTLRSVMG